MFFPEKKSHFATSPLFKGALVVTLVVTLVMFVALFRLFLWKKGILTCAQSVQMMCTKCADDAHKLCGCFAQTVQMVCTKSAKGLPKACTCVFSWDLFVRAMIFSYFCSRK